MIFWQMWCLIGLILLIIEMFTPTLFFLNLAISAMFTAIAAYFGIPFIWQTIIFSIFSIMLVIFIRPIMISKIKNNNGKTGIESKYINQTATVVSEVTAHKGRISIYGEEWDARSINNETIPVSSFVKIIRNESIIMYVESIKE